MDFILKKGDREWRILASFPTVQVGLLESLYACMLCCLSKRWEIVETLENPAGGVTCDFVPPVCMHLMSLTVQVFSVHRCSQLAEAWCIWIAQLQRRTTRRETRMVGDQGSEMLRVSESQIGQIEVPVAFWMPLVVCYFASTGGWPVPSDQFCFHD